jgi:cytochrome c oxidase subunit 2
VRPRARRPVVRWGSAVIVFLVAGTMLTGCNWGDIYRVGLPKPVTQEGHRILTLWQGSWIAAFAVGFAVWGLILWASIFHRRKLAQLPPQVRYNVPIETLFTVVPLIIVATLFFFTARDQTILTSTHRKPDVLVDVVAYQWSWKFYYEDDGVNGRRPTGGVSVVGRAGERRTLVLPMDKRVQFNLYSQDVVHSFWIPAFLFKRDVLPYNDPPHGKQFWQLPKNKQPYWNNKFQVVPDRTGTFAGRCAEYCGTYHSQMLFQVKVVSWSQYQQFLARAQQQAVPAGNGGGP